MEASGPQLPMCETLSEAPGYGIQTDPALAMEIHLGVNQQVGDSLSLSLAPFLPHCPHEHAHMHAFVLSLCTLL